VLASSRTSVPALVLFALTAIAASPLLSAPYLQSYDGLLHLFRLFALDAALRQGMAFPRWLPDLAFGYGYPIYNYYPPLAGYLAETLHIFGLSFPDAIKGTCFAVIALAAFGAYMLGVELFGAEKEAHTSGILTGAAFIFFPYFMVDLYERGALAEALALAILPWLVWSLRRALVLPAFSSVWLTAVFLAILVAAHSLTMAIVGPFLAAYVLFELFRLPSTVRLKALARVTASVLLAGALSAFYWLPFIAELPLVRMGQGMGKLQDIFETSFQSPIDVIQPTILYKYGLSPVPALGLVSLLIAAGGLLLALIAGKKFKERGTLLFFGTVAILGVIIITKPTEDIWVAFSRSSLIQSVWRISILLNLAVAILSGGLPLLITSFNLPRNPPLSPATSNALRSASAAAVVLILIGAAMARVTTEQVYLPPWDFTTARLARFEAFTQNIGTTTFSEYLPVAVKATDLINYRAPQIEATAPSPTIQLEGCGSIRCSFTVNSSGPISISLRAFSFPGWQATVDGTPKPVHGRSQLDLVTVNIPAGQHGVTISLEDTAPRRTGTVMSAAAVLAVLGLAIIAFKRREPEAWVSLLVTGLLLIVIVAPTAVALTASPVRLQPMQLGVAPGVNLIGLGIDGAQDEAGTWLIPNPSDRLHLEVYWHVGNSYLADAPITWRLVGDSGRVWAQRTQLPRYGTALQHTWVLNEIVHDEYDLPLASNLPPGHYTLQVSYGAGQILTSGAIELEAGSQLSVAVPPPIANPINAQLGDQIRLLGYEAPLTARAGQQYPVTLFWQAERDVLEDYVVSAQLLDIGGRLVAQRDIPPADGLSPTSLWIPCETVVDRKKIELPSVLTPGTYTLTAVMYSLPGVKRLTVVTGEGRARDNAVVLGPVQILDHAPNDPLNISWLFSSNR
jgi:hypothetical protein